MLTRGCANWPKGKLMPFCSPLRASIVVGKTDWIRERLDPKEFCPAAGQGALGIEARKNDRATIEALLFLDHADTRFAVTAERAALAALVVVVVRFPSVYTAGANTWKAEWGQGGTRSTASSLLPIQVRRCALTFMLRTKILTQPRHSGHMAAHNAT